MCKKIDASTYDKFRRLQDFAKVVIHSGYEVEVNKLRTADWKALLVVI